MRAGVGRMKAHIARSGRMSQLNCGNAERPVPNAIGRPRDRSLERRSGGRKSGPRPRSVAGLTLSAADLGGDDRRR
jgi:hypothetical protein